MNRYLIVRPVDAETGDVEDVAIWDGESEWTPPEGCVAIASEHGGAGWTVVNGVVTPPPPPPEPEPEPEA